MGAGRRARKASASCRWTERRRRLRTRSPTRLASTCAGFRLRRRVCWKCCRPFMREPGRKIRVSCVVNGAPAAFEAYPMARLLDVLREELQLTGTKEGCGEGECGACAVELNGALVNSCLVPARQATGAKISTIEGITGGNPLHHDHLLGERLHVVQQAFLEHGGAQCGICTPGMILAAVNLLARNSNPSESEIREGLGGNLCRCTGYTKIFESVLAACRAIEFPSEPQR